MTFLVPLIFFGWIFLSIIFFLLLKPHKAVLITLIGGVLFLPQAQYAIEGFPNLSKTVIISISLIIGNFFVRKRKENKFKFSFYEIPLVIFCTWSFFTSISNNLGVYDGIAKFVSDILYIAIPYLIGRKYFTNSQSIKDFCIAIVIGGIIYVPLCLYEIRMSPQLSNIFYGFFPHSFLQHARYGGWRPIVFMSHGLMVSLWMASSSVLAYWLLKYRLKMIIFGIPMFFWVGILFFTTILCKSANGWFILSLGILCSFIFSFSKSKIFFILLLLITFSYPALRITHVISSGTVLSLTNIFFDSERVSSLRMRLNQENLFVNKAKEKFIFGWGDIGGGWPTLEDGTSAIPMIDPLWLIYFHVRGFIGLLSYFFFMLQGPWLIFRNFDFIYQHVNQYSLYAFTLCLVITFFMIDSLVNGMPNPVYFTISGALISFFQFNVRLYSTSNDAREEDSKGHFKT